MVYVAAALLSWLDFGAPNPRGLGYLSKGVEVVLFVALLIHVWLLSRSDASTSTARSSDQAVLAR